MNGEEAWGFIKEIEEAMREIERCTLITEEASQLEERILSNSHKMTVEQKEMILQVMGDHYRRRIALEEEVIGNLQQLAKQIGG